MARRVLDQLKENVKALFRRPAPAPTAAPATPTPEVVWAVEIVLLSALLQERERASRGALELVLPNPRADEGAIAAAEAALGARLDSEHRAFLAHADGWNDLSSSADLFGTPDLRGSARYRAALHTLRRAPRGALGRFADRRNALVPISHKEGIPDVFAMAREGSWVRPEVIWVSGAELVGEFASFGEMFVNFRGLTQRSIDRWIAKYSA